MRLTFNRLVPILFGVAVLCFNEACVSMPPSDAAFHASVEGGDSLSLNKLIYCRDKCYSLLKKTGRINRGFNSNKEDCTFWLLNTSNHELVVYFPNAMYGWKKGLVYYCIVNWKTGAIEEVDSLAGG